MMMMMASESLKVLEFEGGLRTQYLRCFEEAFWMSGDDGGVRSSMSLSPPCLPLQILGGASSVA